MEWLKKIIQFYLNNHKKLARWRKLVSLMAAIVVFVTTYALILPAITIDKKSSTPAKGMYLEDPEGDSYHRKDLSDDEEWHEEYTQDSDDESDSPNSDSRKSDSDRTDPEEWVEEYRDEDEETNQTQESASSGSPRQTLKASNDYYTVTLSYDEDASLPEDAVLQVTELEKGTREYKKYLKKVKKALLAEKENKKITDIDVRFFDLSILDDGREIQPYHKVDLDILTAPVKVDKPKKIKAVHFWAYNEQKEEDLFEPEILKTKAEEGKDGVETVHFQAEEAAMYAVVYSVKYEDKTAEEPAVREGQVSSEARESTSQAAREEGTNPARTEGTDAAEAKDTRTEETGQDENSKDKTALKDAEEKPGKDENAETTENDKKESESASGTLEVTDEDYDVSLSYGPDARIPENAELDVKELAKESKEYNKYLKKVKKTLSKARKNKKLDKLDVRFFDITIRDGKNQINPDQKVNVEIKADPVKVEDPAQVQAVHFDGEEAEPELIEATTEETKEGVESVRFQADDSSVYGVIYSAEYRWMANGKTYEYKISSGDAVSFKEIAESLQIIDTSADSATNTTTATDTNAQPAADEGIDQFIADIDQMRFSDESLVQVAQIEKDSKKADGKTLQAPDWTLTRLKGFDTTETLTVDMKDGEEFTINVTSEISTDFISADGETYKITVSYGDDAGIPDGAELKVEEILEGSKEYKGYLKDSADKLNVDSESIPFARFFDIEILDKEGKKIEPKATVQVDISLKEIPDTETDIQIVHFEEDGPVVIPTKEVLDLKGEKAISFDTDGFSVYGTIVEPAPTGVTDLDGRTFTISRNGNYLTTDINHAQEAADQFNKVTDGNQAATWRFEAVDAANGQYNIFTYDSNGEKMYMNLNHNVTANAHAALSNTPQAFIVTQNNNGTYTLSTVSNNQTYYLNEFGGNGTGFAGWYQKSSPNDELTLTFTQPVISNNAEYMTLVKYNGKYYIVNNDATLTEVDYYEGSQTVRVDDPMEWNVDRDTGHIWYHTKETGFNGNQLASDYFRMYLDPSQDTALNEETSDNVTVEHDNWHTVPDSNPPQQYEENHISNRDYMLTQTAVSVIPSGSGTYTISHGDSYLGLVIEDGVPVRLTGNKTEGEAAEFVFAETHISDVSHLNNTVSHIDISISGTASVSVPLAYGNYYGPDGDNGDPIKVVNSNTKLLLQEDQLTDPDQIRITTNDLKRATITATRKDTGEELDDAFYITGYSGNVATQISNDQVRIEGSFLVADLRGTEYEHIDGTRYDGTWWQGADQDYVNAVHTARLNNIVEYTVTVVKPLTYNLVDPEVGQLYDEEGNPIQVTVDVAFSASFNYWDDESNGATNGGNECPPLWDPQYGYSKETWLAGGIWPSDGSGMDFVLGGDAENPDSPLVALEITKVIMDEEGNRIELKTPVYNYFEIYEKKNIPASPSGNPSSSENNSSVVGLHVVDDINHPTWQADSRDDTWLSDEEYKLWETKKVKVDQTGSAIVFDFNANDAMYYIVEKHDEDSLPRTVTDKDGNVWSYVKTYMETEYVRRDEAPFSYDEYSNKTTHPGAMHITQEYSGQSDSYASIPEVAGNFIMMNGSQKKEGFLEFYCYNIYKKGVDFEVEKVWIDEDSNRTSNTEVKVELFQANRLVANSDGPLDEANIQPWPDKDSYTLAKNEPLLNGKIEVTELYLKASDNWKGIFEELPHTVTDEQGNTYEIDYYAKETQVLMNGVDVSNRYRVTTNKTEPSSDQEQYSDGKVTITNEVKTLNVTAKKTWNPEPTNGSVTLKLRRYRKPLPATEASVEKVWDDDNDRDRKRPSSLTATLYRGDEVVQTVTLNDSNDWKATVSNLPVGKDDKPYSYHWTEGTEAEVKGYTADTPVIKGTKTTFTNRYIPDTVDITYTVNWDDYNNVDEKRPEYVVATLLSNGQDGQEVRITGDSTATSWTKTVTVPKNKDGEEISYSWTSPTVPDNYTQTAVGANSVTFYHEAYYTVTISTSGLEGQNIPHPLPSGTYLAGTSVTLSVNSNTNWNNDTYTIQGGPNGDVTVGGQGNVDITFTINRNYVFNITSNHSGDWYDDWMTYSLSPQPNRSSTRQLNKATSVPASRSKSAVNGVRKAQTQPSTRATQYTDDTLPTAPAGYEIDGDFDAKNITITLNNNTGWQQAFPNDYPTTDIMGEQYYYFVEEVDSPNTYWIEDYQDTLLVDTGMYEIKNTKKPINLAITKINDSTPVKNLAGARFEMYALNENNADTVEHVGSVINPVTNGDNYETGDDGLATFINLPDGYYEISEKDIPAGYVLNHFDGVFYIKVEYGVITLLNKESGKAPKDWSELTSQMVEIGSSSVGEDGITTVTATVKNESGAELPHTGGPGTRMVTILGMIMIMGAGLAFLVLKKREEVVF